LGDKDIGEPVYSVADGMVTLAQDFEAAWGNVVIIAFRVPDPGAPGGKSLLAYEVMYAHLDTMDVKPTQMVKRGQKIGTIGNAHGLYKAHLHWEIRRVIGLGLGSGFDPTAEDTVWLNPTQTILPWRGESAEPPKMRKVPPSQRVEWGTTAPGAAP
jgi:murein DD-endopeptidase MepM/ murein hydrolase activator NlpD